ncbi:hypothetical protein L1049_026968 [Liquidambar formosana]|uniref:Uncharacterized protein n=1 Tax=Liquidambar formosana TaxID=63359 RepID=A0AAP0R8G4_LIQFO
MAHSPGLRTRANGPAGRLLWAKAITIEFAVAACTCVARDTHRVCYIETEPKTSLVSQDSTYLEEKEVASSQLKRDQMAPEPEDEIKDEKNPRPLDEDDIALLKTYGLGPYSTSIKKAEKEIKEMAKKVNDLCGIKESDTGLSCT